jgi:hypothetical protein
MRSGSFRIFFCIKKYHLIILKIMENSEIWKDVVGYDGLYQVSNFGNIKSLDRKRWSGRNNSYSLFKGKELSKSKRRGYLRVSLTKSKIEKTFSIHRLVAIAFIPNPENKPQVNHKDGDKLNNNEWNLEWNTASENTQHSFDNGLQVIIRGEGCYNSKLTAKDVLEIRKSKLPQRKLGKIYGISGSIVCEVRNRKTWSHI